MLTETSPAPSIANEERQLVTFLLKDDEFGFDIMSVREIIRMPKMAKIPRTLQCVEGIANLRGVILPIIDGCVRLGMERSEETDATRVLVVDIGGVKTGLRVDRVTRVTQVLPNQLELPPATIRGIAANYLQGIVKLDNGQRFIMALDAARVCLLDAIPGVSEERLVADDRPSASGRVMGGDVASQGVVQMVTFYVAGDEFAFRMEHVREVLRVRTPKQVPDVPDHVLGVLALRGQVLPIMDLRRLLQRTSLAEDLADECRKIRESHEHWCGQIASQPGRRTDRAVADRLRAWISGASRSSRPLIEILSKVRGLNEKLIKELESQAPIEEIEASGVQVSAALRHFEQEVGANVQEDQRIIVVDVQGFAVGLVVDRVNEVLNVTSSLLDPPPVANSRDGVELEAVAKLSGGNRLIMLLDPARLVKDHKADDVRNECASAAAAEHSANAPASVDTALCPNEVQLVTFMLGNEEYGVPISNVKEINRLAKITKIPNAAAFIEGVTNLRGEVITVLDTRKRFELEAREYNDRTRIIIVELNGTKTGLVVDSVNHVMRLSKIDIAPPPDAIQSRIDQRFIAGIGKVEPGNRLIVILDVEKIVTTGERTDSGEI